MFVREELEWKAFDGRLEVGMLHRFVVSLVG
jgi:hypothetical protein